MSIPVAQFKAIRGYPVEGSSLVNPYRQSRWCSNLLASVGQLAEQA